MTVIMAWERSQGNSAVTPEKPVSTLLGPMWGAAGPIQCIGDLRSAHAATGNARPVQRNARSAAYAATRPAPTAGSAPAAARTAGLRAGDAGTRCAARQAQA